MASRGIGFRQCECTEIAAGDTKAAWESTKKGKKKNERKEAQVAHAPHISEKAKLVKLADKISNLRDIANSPPYGWNTQRKQEYFDWAARVVEGIRGTHEKLESLFDQAYAFRPKD